MTQQRTIERLMSVDEFLAFYEARPAGERWELIDGRPVMSPSPTLWHQIIGGNIVTALGNARAERNAKWVPLLGASTRVPLSPRSLPQPDVMVLEDGAPDEPSPVAEEALILFEILSSSNTRSHQAWRKRVYASIPNLEHYLTVSQKEPKVVRYDREDGWAGVVVRSIDDTLDLPAISVSIPLSLIYRWTPLADPGREHAGRKGR